MPRIPRLRHHPSRGYWYTHWGGKDHYFGQHETRAVERFAQSLQDWSAWRTQQPARGRRFPSRPTCLDLIEQFLEAKLLEGGKPLKSYYAKHLKRFNRLFATACADEFRPLNLQALKNDMLRLGFAPKTICHDLVAVRGLFSWGSGLEMIPAVNLKGVKNPPLGPPQDKSMPLVTVRRMVAEAPERLKPWLAVNYLCLMRPSEVVRVVHKQGDWTEHGIFRLDRGKIDLRARMARHVVFSEEALGWLDRCQPVWSRPDSYAANVSKLFSPLLPGRLRHSAATHLLRAGAMRADIDLLLGHAPTRVSLTYAQIVWPPLRQTVALLTL